MANQVTDRVTVGLPWSELPGEAGEIVSATATELPPGSEPTVTLGGTPSERTLEFGIPVGEKGDPGSGSVNSVNGDPGPDVVLDAGDVGATSEVIFDQEVGRIDTELAAVEERIDSLPAGFSGSFVRHVEKSAYSYEVIRVFGGFGAIKKIQPANVSPAGTIPTAQMLTPKQMSEESGYTSLVNADAIVTSSGTATSVGLQIIDGEPVRDFGQQGGSLTGSDREALLLMRDGSLQPARATDGLGASDYVSLGAFSSFGYGPILVENGVIPSWYTDPAFSGFSGQLSARTILGQASNGDYIIITVDGRSGVNGITGQEISQVAVDEGCEIAVNLDGGGTTQAVWKRNLVHPSTDTGSFERTSMSFMAIVAPQNNEYDSGPIALPPASGVSAPEGSGAEAVSLRQQAGGVTLILNAFVTPNITTSAWSVLSSPPVPARYRAASDYLMKGAVYGQTGGVVGISTSNTFILNARTPVGTSNAALGRLEWDLPYA